MARTKGLLPLSGNFEPQVAGPFDARGRVETKADLLLTATWQAKDSNPYTYVGMVVSVYADAAEGNNGIYRLKATDYTQENNWEKAGGISTVYADGETIIGDGSPSSLLGVNKNEIIPYVGATKNVDLGNFNLKANGLEVDIVTPLVIERPGQIGWNAIDGTFNFSLLNGTALQVGQELHFFGKASGLITNGDVVQFGGVQGDHFLIKKAVPSEINLHPEYLLGVATNTIIANEFGYITCFGKINEISTRTWTLVQPVLYFDFNNGGMTQVVPSAPTRRITIASVIKLSTGEASNGIIFVRPSWGFKITDLDDVNGTPLTTSGQIMIWNNDLGVFDFTGSINDFMKESDYVGESGYKQVNYSKYADEAEQAIHAYSAQQDALGREIHTTYALKQSGVTPPETARVILDNDTPTYTIVALTAENLIVENNATTGGEVIAPVLVADKTLKITIQGNDTLLNGNTYEDGVTIFAIYEASTETWTFSSILDPEVPDYSDMTVDVMVDNPSITPKPGYIRISGEVWILGTMVFLRTTDTPTPIGIYQCVGAGAGYSNLVLIAAGTALHTVRVKGGDVWYSQYDGANAGTLVFESFDNKVDKNGTDRLITSEEAFLLENMSPIEFEVTDVINGIIIPESPTKLYRISTATDLTVTINTGLLDLTKYIKLFVKINLNDYVVLTFPENWYFANLAIPTEVGEYLYEVSSSDGGETWRASLRYKNIATVGIDQEGNEIVGAKLLFVDGEKADNSGDGLTWLTAKKDVQAAIDIANTGDAVFVKGKIGGLKYLPTTERTPGTARTKSFIMKAGVNVYGGFKGIESTLYEREMVSYLQVMKLPTGAFNMYVDIPKYVSILSGEIAGDSIIDTNVSVGNPFTAASIANNSYTVVVGATNATLNGFEIIGGSTTTAGHVSGVTGGIIANCKIYNNSNSNTGTVHSAIITNSIVQNNSSSNQAGINVSTATNCIVNNNRANISSAGIGNGITTNCACYGNTAANGGGLLGTTAINCSIYNNTATNGGGVNGATLTNCSIYNNTASNGGGVNGGTLTNCSIYNNTATTGGGVNGGTLTNCSIYNNTATTGGGVNGGTLTNCSVIRNKCTTSAGGTNNCLLNNTVVFGNKHASGVISNVVNTNSSEETYSAFEDEVRAGTGNISLSVNNEGDATSPYFQSLSTDAGVVDEIYVSNPKIGNSSFLIDKGLDSANNAGYGALYDLSGLERKVDTIDIGAYENQKTV